MKLLEENYPDEQTSTNEFEDFAEFKTQRNQVAIKQNDHRKPE